MRLKLHRRFCKFILKVPSSATNVGVYGELGRKPMQLRRSLLSIKYWLRLSIYRLSYGNVSVLIKSSTQHG